MHQFILLLCVASFSIDARCEAEPGCPLGLRVKPFVFRAESRLAALVRFGRENHISLGVESLADDPLHVVPDGPARNTARATILQILGRRSSYHLSCLSGVVIVRDERAAGPKWLDRKLPLFQTERTTLAMAEGGLWMRAELLLDPTQTGFIGDVLGDDPKDKVGPYKVRNATVRSLLCLIAGSSKGAAWITASSRRAQFLGTASENELWTFVRYSTGNP